MIAVSLVPCGAEIYGFGQYDEEFGGAGDHLAACVSLSGFFFGVASSPLFATAAWFAVRVNQRLFERPYFLAVLAALLVWGSYSVMIVIASFRS